MKEEGIKAVWIKKFKPLGNKIPVRGLKNIVNREFKPERKNKIWVTDITYIWTTRGFVYLSSIMELYSRKGNPVGQYGIESFHSIIKREWLNRYRIEDVRQARRLIFEYIETFYNSRRIHSHCNMLSPNKYEKRYG